MWYVGIDQHKRHLTVCARNEQGEIVLRRQVKTKWLEVHHFLESLRQEAEPQGGYVAILEVCGFNRWLIRRLKRYGCRHVYLIAPPERIRQKTDRRDAARLSELLWLNRGRVADGQRLLYVSEVYQASDQEEYDRQLTHLRGRLGAELTRVKNSLLGILRTHNLEQECPTKGGFTQAAVQWMRIVELPELDRLAMDFRLGQFDLLSCQLQEVNRRIDHRAAGNRKVRLLRTLPKIGPYTALALAAHIGPIERFATARSLANYFGLTPGCRNSGESDRPTGITKAGHPFVRFLLAQVVLHALRGDPGLRQWYRQIKRRRGSKIARVAVMRRLCEKIWHMLSRQEPYQPVGVGKAHEAAPKRSRDKRSRNQIGDKQRQDSTREVMVNV